MNTGIVNDALNICLNIYNAIPPTATWTIVNIGKAAKPTFIYPNISEIPTSFGYTYDNLPRFLKDEGVIEAWVKGKWFTSLVPKHKPAPTDQINVTASQKGYLSQERAEFYNEGSLLKGPDLAGQYAVLINMKKLVEFHNKYTSSSKQSLSSPVFDISTGTLSFVGESVQIKGEINIQSMNLLIKNINSRVSYKELYEVRKNTNYTTLVKQKSKTVINDIVEKVWRSLRTSIEANPKLRKVLVFVQREGFGIFIDQKGLKHITAPQTTPQAPPQNNA